MNAEPKVISLYSFKGGAGRTVCTANIAGLLAREIEATEHNPILLMDMDLDSAGLTILLEQYSSFSESPYNTSRIVSGDLNLNRRKYRQEFYSAGMIDVSTRVGADEGTVRFIGAGEIGRGQPSIVQGTAMEQMQELKNYCMEKGISTIILDSASGRQESAVLCHRFSDVIVYCCRLTDQFLVGTKSVLKHFVSECEAARVKLPRIIIVPLAVPQVTDEWKQRHIAAMTRLGSLSIDVRGKSPNNSAYLFEDGVGEVESFKWVESVLATKQTLAQDEEKAVGAYTSLVKKIVEMAEL
jgi:cellulose biosynthesis protein BcsQ